MHQRKDGGEISVLFVLLLDAMLLSDSATYSFYILYANHFLRLQTCRNGIA
jgi:hypothetical protein